MTSNTDAKLRETLRTYFAEEDPSRLEEFDTVFPHLLLTLKQTGWSDMPPAESRHHGSPFDFSRLADLTVAAAVLAASKFLLAGTRVVLKDDLPKTFDTMESKLSVLTGKPQLVKRIRSRIERLLQEL